MPYGKEAKEALLKLVEGKCLTVHVYNTDRYGRSVGDLHVGGVFVQVRNQEPIPSVFRTAQREEAAWKELQHQFLAIYGMSACILAVENSSVTHSRCSA